MHSFEIALGLWRRKLSVIPVPRPGGRFDGKVPAIPWREFQDRRPSEAELRHWFKTELNVAVITGEISGVVVVDADSPEALRWIRKRLPYTPWQSETARGFHLWYRHPGVRVGNRARLETQDGRLAIDVRGDGGFVIAPGSIHASGHEYRRAGDWSIPRDQLPRFWVGWLRRQQRPTTRTRTCSRPTGDMVERARRYLSKIPQPQIGNGSDAETLYAACRIVRGFDVDENTAVDLLWEWAGGRPGWTRDWIARKVGNAQQYGTEPVGALR